MEKQLQEIIEEANKKLIEAKLLGNPEIINMLNILISETEVNLKDLCK